MRDLTPLIVLCIFTPLCAGQSNKDVLTAKSDLNGDGKAETISISPKTRQEGTKYKLTVNSKSLVVDLDGQPVDGIHILDIDKKDKYREIEAYTYGPSDDYDSRIFRWDGKRIIDLGQTGGSFKILGGGRLLVSCWVGFATKSWVIGLDKTSNKLKDIENVDLLKMNCKTTTTKGLTVFANSSCRTPIAFVPAGRSIELVAGKELKPASKSTKYGQNTTILLRTSDGTIGWAPMVVAMESVKNFPCAD